MDREPGAPTGLCPHFAAALPGGLWQAASLSSDPFHCQKSTFHIHVSQIGGKNSSLAAT